MTKELADKIQHLEQEITKWKYKYNLRNAEYILLWNEFEKYKKKGYWPWIIALGLVGLLLYSYSKKEK